MTAASYHDRKVADEFTAAHSQCRTCGNTAERETLSAYGGLCGGCYSDYVTARRPNPPAPSKEERVASLKRLGALIDQRGVQPQRAWAQRLQRREEAGEALSTFQREAWRRALRVGSESHTEAPQ